MLSTKCKQPNEFDLYILTFNQKRITTENRHTQTHTAKTIVPCLSANMVIYNRKGGSETRLQSG